VVFILDENNDHIPIWVFAADAIAYEKAYQKDSVVVGPGQREAMLLQFNKTGTYSIMQIVINDFQNIGELAELDDNNYFAAANTEPEEVVQQVSVNFVVQSELDKAPVPQFGINGKLFD
jgi:FtsP/CotA-like multicopper oxidase with cupredoxin domain